MRVALLIIWLTGCSSALATGRSPDDEWRMAVSEILMKCSTSQCIAMRAKLLTLMWEEIEDDR